MTPANAKIASERVPPEHISIRIEGSEISWAGPHPFEDGFSLGSDDGMVAFTDEKGKITDKPQVMALSHEAINGVAGFDNWVAASTRQEVTVLTLPKRSGDKAALATFSQGAHGVLASSSKQFVAPLGHAGLMMVNPSEGPQTSFCTYPFGDGSINIYQVQEMPGNGTHNLFVAACRSHGVGLIELSSDKQAVEFDRCNLNGIDVVDVVPVGNATYPHAVVAVGIGGEVMLFRDIVKHEDPIFLKYAQFVGKTYRILSSWGHLFVLTSKAIYVLGNVANRLTQPSLGDHDSPVMTLPMAAIDANICGNRWLLAVMQDEVHRYDIRQIHDKIAEFPASPLPRIRLNSGDWNGAKANFGLLLTAAG
jgi:hypothetical protein